MMLSRVGTASVALAVLATCNGCASMFIHGGRLVNARYPVANAIGVYDIASCHDANGGPVQSPGATYHVLPEESGPALLERSPDGSVLITNRWEDDQATHFFAWGAGLGWEYTLPVDGSVAERLGHFRPSSTQAADGTRRPLVSAAPASTCALVLVSGAPPGARAGVGPTRPATRVTVVQQPPPSWATAPVTVVQQRAPPPRAAGTPAPVSAGESNCAAGRVETEDGHCCMPGQTWDVAQRACASPSTTCAEGRVETRDGYCCWPGQTFDRSGRVCAGPPDCPPGLGAAGEECVPLGGVTSAPSAPSALPVLEPEGDVEAIRAQARAHFQARRFREAADEYERATRLAPTSVNLWSGLGAARLAAGDPGGAALAYERAVQLSPTTAAYRSALGRAYEQAGNREAARGAYQRALELEPGNREATVALSRF